MIQPWTHKKRYGTEASYFRGMEWLRDCDMVEDWGCALGYSKRYRMQHKKCGYRGIDGTAGIADVVTDLSIYRSQTDGLFMRHILEHNLDWRVILNNAIASFTHRMSLILFLPLTAEDGIPSGKPITHTICEMDFRDMVRPYVRHELRIAHKPDLNDTVFLLEKP